MVSVESRHDRQFREGLARSLLYEIGARLVRLAEEGEESAIDLRSLPMMPADMRDLETSLGRGDANVTLNVAGRSEIWETAYPGVWWIRHYGDGEKIAAERIEIATVPGILMADPADVLAAASRLRGQLGAEKGSFENGE